MALQIEGFSATMTTCTMAPTRPRGTAQRRQRAAAWPRARLWTILLPYTEHFELLE
jgi:hypothetical protein